MTILYDILLPENLVGLDDKKKVEFISEIITIGRYDYYEKFIETLDKDITKMISSTEILTILPMIIDVRLLKLILSKYQFTQGQHFFFNYAQHSENKEIKEMIYDYFVENYSHIMVDNMTMYETLLEN